jgi:hypothetical protein
LKEEKELTVEEAQNILSKAASPPAQGKNKKKVKQPAKEEIMAAVAAVVLAEFEQWPEEVQSLIGEAHPNKDSFLKGVSYIIGAYMSIAREELQELVKKKHREIELDVIKEMGPISNVLKSLREGHRDSVSQAVRDLELERDRKLKEAREAIRREYEGKIAKAKNTPIPQEIEELAAKERALKDSLDGMLDEVSKHAASIMADIVKIDEAKDGWNSKSRRKRRLERKAGDEVQDQV